MANLLYRASENKFEVKKFHWLCDGISSTLILSQNVSEVKIAAFSPIPWKSNAGWYVEGNSGESFIFLVNQNDKFELFDKSKAVYHFDDDSFAFSFREGRNFAI